MDLVSVTVLFSCFASRFHQRSEQPALRLVRLQPFRMPLHADAKRVIRKLKAFDQRIGRIRNHPQNRRNALNALMVQAVYFKRFAAQDLRQATTSSNSNRMSKCIPGDVRVPIVAQGAS